MGLAGLFMTNCREWQACGRSCSSQLLWLEVTQASASTLIGPGSGTGVGASTTNAGEVWQGELQRRGQEQTDPISYLFLYLFFLQIKGNLSLLQDEELSETWDG